MTLKVLTQLLPHQRDAYRHLRKALKRKHGGGACLFDAMGLGKSLVAIALLAKQAKPGARFVFVVPATVREVIVRELHKHLSMNGVTVVKMEDTARGEPLVRALLTSDDNASKSAPTVGIIVTSYHLLSTHAALLLSHLSKRSMVIFDEVHHMNNPETQVYQNVKKYLPKNVKCLMMSGTPVSNEKDMLGLSSIVFRNIPSLQQEDAFSGSLHPDLSKRMVCRSLEEVDLTAIGNIPPMHYVARYIPLCEAGKSQYEEELPRAKLAGQRAHSTNDPVAYYAALERLSIASTHFQISDVRKGTIAYADASISNKQEVILELIQEAIAKGEKIVICAYHVTFLKILEPYLQLHGIASVAKVYGGQTSSLKNQHVAAFQRQGPETPTVMLLSMTSGSQGISLTEATTIVMVDSPPNPAIYDQAIDRIHRIGQLKVTRCIHLLSEGTLDEIYYSYVYPSKRYQVNRILGKLRPAHQGESVPSELESLLSHLQSCWNWTQQCTASQYIPYSPERGGPPFITIRAPRQNNEEGLLHMQRSNVSGGLNQWLEICDNTQRQQKSRKNDSGRRGGGRADASSQDAKKKRTTDVHHNRTMTTTTSTIQHLPKIRKKRKSTHKHAASFSKRSTEPQDAPRKKRQKTVSARPEQKPPCSWAKSALGRSRHDIVASRNTSRS